MTSETNVTDQQLHQNVWSVKQKRGQESHTQANFEWMPSQINPIAYKIYIGPLEIALIVQIVFIT